MCCPWFARGFKHTAYYTEKVTNYRKECTLALCSHLVSSPLTLALVTRCVPLSQPQIR
jgi:hypothetical protein